MNSFRTDAVRVRAPATSANLGPGYDSLGLALQLHDEVQARITPHGYTMKTTGEGGSYAESERPLVVRALLASFERLGDKPAGLALHCTNRIPHGRGLGSSAAAIVTGILLARALVPDGAQRLPDAEAFALAVDIEGHPDNVAACFHGGLTIAWTDAGSAHAVRAEVTEAIRPVLFVPPFESATAAARGLLPATVTHADAAFGVGRGALLVAALTGAVPVDGAVLLAATEDRLHQDHRAPVLGDSSELIRVLRAAGTAAVVSGAGPSVLALARSVDEVDGLSGATPDGWRCLALPVDAAGARVV
jgi:homoserine kinase